MSPEPIYSSQNYLEVLEACGAFTLELADDLLAFLRDEVLVDPWSGDPERDDFTEWSARRAVRDGILMLYEVDEATRTVEVLSVEVVVRPANLS